MNDYQRIEKAIQFIEQNARHQPGLNEIAASINLSPYHFQRMFTRWAGLTPKRYLQIITLVHAKQLLSESKPVLHIADELGLSSSSRLHDHFVQLEAVTPGQYKQAGQGLQIRFGIQETPFGTCFLAITNRGICKLSFLDGDTSFQESLTELHRLWPNAQIQEDPVQTAKIAHEIFDRNTDPDRPVSLLVRGTNFQIMVWKALLEIPPATLQSYLDIATSVGNPSSVRAVGSAIGANPIAFLIPCHRVIRQNGEIGGYRWGNTRKHAIHAWESAAV